MRVVKRHDNDKDKDNDNDKDNDKYKNPNTQTQRYLTLVILFMPVTLVTLFQSYNQFYRAEYITVSGFLFIFNIIVP